MIEGFLREKMNEAYPQLVWTENNYEALDHTGTIYREAGEKPSKYEDDLRFPYYMIYVRSSDYDLAQRVAEGSVDVLNKLHNIEWTDYEGKQFHIIFIEAASDANRIGRVENVMEWSTNFKVTLRRIQ